MSFERRRFRDVRRRSARRLEDDAAGARHYILCAVSTPRAIRPGNNGWVCHAVVIDRTPLSTLKNRTCSVPIQAGCQAVSTFMMSLSPSSTRHEPEYAIIVSKEKNWGQKEKNWGQSSGLHPCRETGKWATSG